MKINQAIVVAKLHQGESWHYPRTQQARVVRAVIETLKKYRIRYRIRDRKFLRKKLQAQLIIAVGGDGTLLAASHFANDIPILGVNSMPGVSTGFFCKARASTFPRLLEQIKKGKIKPKPIYRIQLSINKKTLPILALNDVLFASGTAGDTTRYALKIGYHQETQKSSGVWIAAAAGSTAAIYSAGGKRESLQSKRLQYRVREPVRFPTLRYRLVSGFTKTGKTISITSHTDDSMIFIDGPHLKYFVPFGKTVTCQGGAKPVFIFL